MRFERVTRAPLVTVCFGVLCRAQTWYPPASFGQVLVNGTTSQMLSFSFYGLNGTPSFSMQYGLEFTAGSATCNGSGVVSCSVPVTFSPQHPGVRTDAVVVKDSSNRFLGTIW
ncbi:MAG: hypothetical protein JO211_10695 [Acidobacteriaceae bacterium]|nr:hypothetical protein [Acidobacteriaceae bacterium]